MIYPTIGKDGSMGEVDLKYKTRYLTIAKQEPIVFNINGNISESPTQVDELELTPFGFTTASSQTAVVDVYVSKKFLSECQEGGRIYAIQDFVQRNAAWFFTYGRRSDIPLKPSIQDLINGVVDQLTLGKYKIRRLRKDTFFIEGVDTGMTTNEEGFVAWLNKFALEL